MKELKKRLKELMGYNFIMKSNIINQPNTPQLPWTKIPTNMLAWRDTRLQVHMQQRMALSGINGRRGLWSSEGAFSQCRGMPRH